MRNKTNVLHQHVRLPELQAGKSNMSRIAHNVFWERRDYFAPARSLTELYTLPRLG